MEPNTTPGASPELNTAPIAAEPAKKSKGLLTTTIIFALIAIVGVGFGIYGMFFQPKPTCETNCSLDVNNQTDANSASESPLTVAEITKLLEEKYGLIYIDGTYSDHISKYFDNFDQTAKIVFTIRNKLGETPNDDCIFSEPEITYAICKISYDTLNGSYRYYFGNSDDIKKEDYEFKAIGLIKMVYLSDEDAFDVYYPWGIGGYSPIRQINKVVDTYKTTTGFSATVLTTKIDSSPKSTSPCFSMSDGNNTYSYVDLTEDDLKDIAESLSAYKFNFIEEDDEYKLVSIEKI